MDFFRLLARSTGLQKSAATPRQATHLTPSAGFADEIRESESIEKQPGESNGGLQAGKKRKRPTTDDLEERAPNSWNFFRETTSSNQSNGHAVTGPETEADQKLLGTLRNGSITYLSEEDCKQTFKKHKLKVTVLDHKDKITTSRSKSAKKSKDNVNKKNNRHDLIWPQPLTAFDDLHVKYRIAKRLSENLRVQGYREPTEVQTAALPLLLGSDVDRGLNSRGSRSLKPVTTSDVDLLTVAPTGSGKTLAFLIPLFQRLIERRHRTTEDETDAVVQAVVLAPTHELVDQIVNEGRKLAQGVGVKIAALQKGFKLYEEVAIQGSAKPSNKAVGSESTQAPKANPVNKAHVIVSSPGTMIHALSNGASEDTSSLPTVEYLILDEADVLLDPLFRDQTMKVWKACENVSLQTSLWSATIGSSIESLAQTYILERRRRLELTDANLRSSPHHILRLVVGLKDSALPLIDHRLTYAATEQGKLLAVRQILHPSAPSSSTSTSKSRPSLNQPPTLQPPFLIFTQTIPRAIALHSELLYDIHPEAGGSSRIAVLHADLSSTARANIMSGLRKGEIWIVITTDLLSRGIDIRGLNGVVNYDIPTTGAAYIHRVGRTGRQGREGGVAITLYTQEDVGYVRNIANVIAATEAVKKKDKAKNRNKNATSTTEPEGHIKAAQNPESDEEQQPAIQQWLLDALPTVNKKTKKLLKKRGVESRRVGAGKTSNPSSTTTTSSTHQLPTTTASDTKGSRTILQQRDEAAAAKLARRSRISTKSGYDRRMEDRRKGGAMKGISVDDRGFDVINDRKRRVGSELQDVRARRRVDSMGFGDGFVGNDDHGAGAGAGAGGDGEWRGFD